MTKPFKRVPKGYDGLKPTGRQIKDLLPQVLQQVEKSYKTGADQAFDAWLNVVSPQYVHMTRMASFHSGVLTIHVNNSALLNLLNQHEKTRLLQELQVKFPALAIRALVFRLGMGS